jgi:hypothetical protein
VAALQEVAAHPAVALVAAAAALSCHLLLHCLVGALEVAVAHLQQKGAAQGTKAKSQAAVCLSNMAVVRLLWCCCRSFHGC